MWIRKTPDPAPQHSCQTPARPPEKRPLPGGTGEWVDWASEPQPEGQEGDIWVCDKCLTVWQVQRRASWDKSDLVWRNPNWFVRWLAIREYWKRKQVSK